MEASAATPVRRAWSGGRQPTEEGPGRPEGAMAIRAGFGRRRTGTGAELARNRNALALTYANPDIRNKGFGPFVTS